MIPQASDVKLQRIFMLGSCGKTGELFRDLVSPSWMRQGTAEFGLQPKWDFG